TAHDDVMAAGGSNLQRSFGMLLADDVAKISAAIEVVGHARKIAGLPRQDYSSEQVRGEGLEALDAVDLHALNERRFRRVGHRYERTRLPPLLRQGNHRQHAMDASHVAIERQFAYEDCVIQRSDDLSASREHPDSDGQVVGGPFLAEIGRGQVHDNSAVEWP